MKSNRQIAYFSMEIALEPGMPTYCGGLGFLAGDLLRGAADQNVLMAGVSLLHRKGYFCQRLDTEGNQTEVSCEWNVEKFVKELAPRTTVSIEGRTVFIRAWQYDVEGVGGAGWAQSTAVLGFCLDAHPMALHADEHVVARGVDLARAVDAEDIGQAAARHLRHAALFAGQPGEFDECRGEGGAGVRQTSGKPMSMPISWQFANMLPFQPKWICAPRALISFSPSTRVC